VFVRYVLLAGQMYVTSKIIRAFRRRPYVRRLVLASAVRLFVRRHRAFRSVVRDWISGKTLLFRYGELHEGDGGGSRRSCSL